MTPITFEVVPDEVLMTWPCNKVYSHHHEINKLAWFADRNKREEVSALREYARHLRKIFDQKREEKKKAANPRKILAEFKDINDIFDLCVAGFDRTIIADQDVSIRRMHCFAFKGVKCVTCENRGDVIRLERWGDGSLHVDLYDTSKDEEVLMTIDHILPKSKGGPNHLNNYQPMCGPCNWKKGNSLK